MPSSEARRHAARRLLGGGGLPPVPPGLDTRHIARGASHLLLASAVCLALVPWVVPDSYSVVEHTLSEAAGQGVQGGWLARTGMILSAFAAFMLAATPALRWGPWGRLAHRLFGAFTVFIAIFEDTPFAGGQSDRFEESIHTVVTVAAGATFVIGVLVVTLEGRRFGRVPSAVDQAAFLAPLVLPLVMLQVDGIDGLAQRLMLGVGIWWYWLEARSVMTAGRPRSRRRDPRAWRSPGPVSLPAGNRVPPGE